MFEHWGDTIYWDRLTWEAFATLVTGLGVVIGATWVGLRQAALQQRTLRLSLFERRYRIYRATGKWVGYILTTGHIPNRASNADADAQTREREFLDAVDESRFVFSPHVFDALEQMWLQGNQLHYHQSSRRQAGEDQATHIDAERRILDWFGQQAIRMAATFGDELKVSDGGPSSFRPLPKADVGAGPPGETRGPYALLLSRVANLIVQVVGGYVR